MVEAMRCMLRTRRPCMKGRCICMVVMRSGTCVGSLPVWSRSRAQWDSVKTVARSRAHCDSVTVSDVDHGATRAVTHGTRT